MILGKYIGTMALLTVPLLIGILFSLLIITTSGKINLTGEDWIKIAVVILLSVLYLSIFVMLGLFVSSLFRSSAASLVILLLVWAVIVVVIPDIGGTLVTSLSQLPSNEAVNRQAVAARSRAYYDYNARHPNASKWTQTIWAYGQDLARAFEGDNALMKVYDNYWDKMTAQVWFGYNVTRISPTVVYRGAVETMAGSGMNHYESYIKQVRKYKLTLRGFLLDHYPLAIYRPHGFGRSRGDVEKNDKELVEALSSRIFTAAEIPQFRDESISMEDTMKNSLWNVALLLTFNIVFFMAAHISFLYQDIK
jgi:ABC-type transport system involved in multi-copper enzyme maturation permease subunit